MKKHIIALLLALATTNVMAETLAHKLTILSLDKEVKANSAEVKRTQDALTRSATVCKEEEGPLVEVVWYITKEIRKKDAHAESTDMIEGINAILLGAKEKQDCKELLALYATNRISGSTHSDAVSGIRPILRAAGIVE